MKNKGLIIFAAVVAVLALIGLGFYGSLNSTRSRGIELETSLSATYEDNQNYLSSYVSSFYEQTGVANLKSAKIDTILSHAVEGRYGDEGFQANGAFFAAVNEAYPDLTQNLQLFDKILDFVQAGREQFRGRQSRLIDQARVYNNWLEDGMIRHMIVQGPLGFPSDNLQARVGGQVVAQGEPALSKIRQVILTGSTVQAYQSGQMEPLTVK